MRDVLQLTLAELASVLDPPVTAAQLQHLVLAIGLQPAGYRRNGQPGRPQACFDAETVMRVHGAVAPWLATRLNRDSFEPAPGFLQQQDDVLIRRVPPLGQAAAR